MKCTMLKVNGSDVIVCGSRWRHLSCVVCKAPAPRLCDWNVGNGKTCDAPICAEHSYQPAPDKDLCPRHAEQWKQRQEKAA